MRQERINRIEISWKGLFKPIEELLTEPDDDPLINEIVIEPEIIPIIFVPGIMGSILRNPEKKLKVWDPDDKKLMAETYMVGCEPAERKKILIGQQSHSNTYLEVYEKDPNHLGKLPNGMDTHGWGGVSWGFYGDILKTMAGHDWPEPLNLCFEFPVYAFGYNWTASNHDSGEKLAAYIDHIIEENKKKLTCNQVILVTHSMGGLVARSACMLHDAKDKVLGVVHGAQPATGAPSAYFRMKNGFEPPDSPTGEAWDWLRNPVKMEKHFLKGHGSRMVLGKSGEDVTIIMANSPGALELLPNKLYKTNDGKSQWLRFTNRFGETRQLPDKNPYEDIYGKQEIAFRLVNTDWLGDNSSEKDDNVYDQQTHDPWHYYKNNLTKAEDFHEMLADTLHPETFQFFSTGVKTPDKVEIKCRRVKNNEEIYVEAHRYKGFLDVVDNKGVRQDLDDLLYISAFSKDTYKDTVLYAYTMEPPNGSGDGTVSDSSGRALKAIPSNYLHGPDGTVDINEDNEDWFARQHDKIYETKTAQKITLRAIENLCKTKIKKETGTA